MREVGRAGEDLGQGYELVCARRGVVEEGGHFAQAQPGRQAVLRAAAAQPAQDPLELGDGLRGGGGGAGGVSLEIPRNISI